MLLCWLTVCSIALVQDETTSALTIRTWQILGASRRHSTQQERPWRANHSWQARESDEGFQIALEEAKKGAAEGGIPIGACLVAKDGKILGRGHNLRMQQKSATIHGEIAALENAGRLPATAYQGATMYTTLSPCDMCTGACILYKVARVVLGENNTFVGGEEYLRSRGVEVVNVKSAECEQLMKSFIQKHPEDWYEDIGEDK